MISFTRQEIRFVTGIGMLRAQGSASCDNTLETTETIYYGHWVLRLVISQTRQRVRNVTGFGICIF